MNLLAVSKLAAQALAGLGASRIVFEVIRNNTTAPLATVDSLMVKAGSYAFASMAVKHVSNHVGEEFTAVANWLEDRRTEDDDNK